ncbi:MAG: hypothetical protein KDB90_14495 [Planctomycetes bacterium]|nr:hypothetical protein [Planctomycetota bacterium]
MDLSSAKILQLPADPDAELVADADRLCAPWVLAIHNIRRGRRSYSCVEPEFRDPDGEFQPLPLRSLDKARRLAKWAGPALAEQLPAGRWWIGVYSASRDFLLNVIEVEGRVTA